MATGRGSSVSEGFVPVPRGCGAEGGAPPNVAAAGEVEPALGAQPGAAADQCWTEPRAVRSPPAKPTEQEPSAQGGQAQSAGGAGLVISLRRLAVGYTLHFILVLFSYCLTPRYFCFNFLLVGVSLDFPRREYEPSAPFDPDSC